MDVLIFRANFLGIKGNTLLNFRGAYWGLEAKGKRLDVASQLKLSR